MNAEQTRFTLKRMPNEMSIMLRAKHGVGKSATVKQVAQQLAEETGHEVGFYDVRLSQCEVGDIKGLPNLNHETKTTDFYKPFWWPRDPDSHGILFFDELNRATKDVLQAVFEVCLDRRLDGEKLPDGWRVVAAINADDDYDVLELDPALLDRWFVIDFDPSDKEWINWAYKEGLHASVIEFISQNTELLDPKIGDMQAGEIYPSRRSWHRLHKAFEAMDLFDSDNEGLIGMIAKGFVGTSCSILYAKFLVREYSRLRAERVVNELPEVREQIERMSHDIEALAALATGVVNHLRKLKSKDFNDMRQKNLKDFLMMTPPEIVARIWSDALKVPNIKKAIALWEDDEEFANYISEVYLATNV